MDIWPCLANRELLIGGFYKTFHRKASILGSLACFGLVSQGFAAIQTTGVALAPSRS